MKSNETIVRFDNVWKSYDVVTAVAGLSFDLAPGRILGLLGHNGAGKTTSIRMILDILKPDKGEITVFGERASAATRNRVGYLPEERGLYKKMKVEELLVFFGRLKGMTAHDARTRTKEWLQRMDLADRSKSAVEDLSKGMQQKVQFIATVLHNPRLLILDEPFSGLDPVNQKIFEELIVEAGREHGASILFSTHVMEQAERLLDDVIMLRKGEPVVQGGLVDVKKQFGAGWLEIRGEGALEALQSLRAVVDVHPAGRAVRARLADGASTRDVLTHLNALNTRIEKFEVLEATLHDIFLSKVGGLDVDTIGEHHFAGAAK